MTYPDIVKNELNQAIKDALEANGDQFLYKSPLTATPIRKSKLPLDTVIKSLLTMDGGSLNREILKQTLDVSASAFSQRRAKLKPAVFEAIFDCFNQAHQDEGTYKGYKLLAVDGSVINCPKNESSPTYTWDGNSGYSAYHLTTLYDIVTNTYHSATIVPQSKQDEIRDLLSLLAWHVFSEPTVIIGDRLFCTYNTLERIRDTGAHYIIRGKDVGSQSAMRPIKQIAEKHPDQEFDVDVSFEITTTQTNEDKEKGRIFIQTGSKKGKVNSLKTKISRWDFASPWPVSFRAIRYRLPSKSGFYTLVTSLPREEFSTQEIIALYSRRWSLELSYRCSKFTMNLVNLHGKKDDYIQQEIWAAMTMQNFVSRIVSQVVLQKRDSNKHEYAVNFKMATMLCKKFFSDPNGDGEKLMRDIARYTEPIRPNREEERNLKTKSFPGFCYRIAA